MAVNDLDARIKEIKNASQKQEEDQAAEIRERKVDEEMRFEKAKLEQSGSSTRWKSRKLERI